MRAPLAIPITPLVHAPGDWLPTRATAGSAGFDLRAADNVALPVGQIRKVPCGFAIAIPPRHEGQIRARSGLSSRHGVCPVNAPGTIDSDYRGEVIVPLINLGEADYHIARGDRIAQLVIAPLPDVRLEVVDTLDATDRAASGFGSTGSS